MVNDYINTINQFSATVNSGVSNTSDENYKQLVELFERIVSFVSADLKIETPEERNNLINSIKNILKPALEVFRVFVNNREESMKKEYDQLITQVAQGSKEQVEKVQEEKVVNINDGAQRVRSNPHQVGQAA